MTYSDHPSTIRTSIDLREPTRRPYVWRDENGDVHAVVYLGCVDLAFRHPAHARAIAEACAATARDMEALNDQPSLQALPDFT